MKRFNPHFIPRLALFLLALTVAQGWGQLQMDRIAPKAVNNVWQVTQLPGANAGAQILDCLTNRIASGGVCDARGYGATTQSIASTITVSGGQTLVFDPSTKFQAATSALNIFTFEPNAVIKGFTFDCTNQPSYSGILFQNDTAQTYGNGNRTEVTDIQTSAASCSGVTGFTALQLTSTSVSHGVSFIKIKGWRIWGGLDGAFFTTSSNGFVNGNHFIDWQVSNAAHGWHITGVTGGAIEGNVCDPCAYEKDSVGVNGVLIDGSGGSIDANLWIGPIWDTTATPPINITHTTAVKNSFIGRFDGTPSDNPNSLNNFFYLSNGQPIPNIAVRGIQAKTLGSGSSSDTLDIFDTTASAANPHKFLRVHNGVLEVVNSGFSSVIATISDTGLITANGGINVAGSVAANTGMQHARVATGNITAGSRAEVLITWPVAFANGNYTATCSVNDSSTGATSQGLVLERTRTQTAAQIGAVIFNPTAGTINQTLNCIGMHD